MPRCLVESFLSSVRNCYSVPANHDTWLMFLLRKLELDVGLEPGEAEGRHLEG